MLCVLSCSHGFSIQDMGAGRITDLSDRGWAVLSKSRIDYQCRRLSLRDLFRNTS